MADTDQLILLIFDSIFNTLLGTIVIMLDIFLIIKAKSLIENFIRK